MSPAATATRRQFLVRLAAAAGCLCLPTVRAGVTAGRPREQAEYGFVLLGDLHFDRWEHHDLDWVRAEKPRDLRQIEGYVAATAEHMPRLFERVRRAIAAAPRPIAAAVHVGDFVEGLCGSGELQAQQFRDACAFVDAARLGAPFLMTKGNHDITGPGAAEAFDATLLPWLARQAGRAALSSNYTFEIERDLFVFFDAYRPDLAWLAALDERAQAARRVFFVVHPPVVPYNARANWHVFARPSQAGERAALLAWLESHGAIVLSGHLHRYACLTRAGHGGAFTQFAVNSVVRSAEERPSRVRSGLSAYSTELLDLEPDFSPGSRAERSAWLEREGPFIRSFDYALAAGYALVWVYPDGGVEADAFLGASGEPWQDGSLLPAGV